MGDNLSRGIAVVNLNECNSEPIHIAGTIQPFGVLFALDEEMKVTQVSENVSDHLSLRVDEALGRPLSENVDPAGAEEVRSVLREQRWHDANPLSIGACGKRFDGIVHHHEGAAILELEPNPETPRHRDPSPVPGGARARAARQHAERACRDRRSGDAANDRIRAGHVLSIPRGRQRLRRRRSDGCGARAVSRLALSASDIPEQARRLYLKNWLRLIFDADQKPARIVPALRPDTGAPLDLSFSVLRSVSPIHIEYMKNMGVRASMSISLIVRNRLWGLISCLNHAGPRRVSHRMRSACEFMGRLASLQIAAFEDRELLASRASRWSTVDALHRAMEEATGSVLAAIVARPDAAGNHWTYTYDSFGRKLTADDPDLGMWRYQYDNADRLIQTTDAKSQATHYTYDPLGRTLTKVTRYNTAQAVTTTYDYDQTTWGYNVGHLTRVTIPGMNYSYNYDAVGRMIGKDLVADGVSYNLLPTYDTGGRLRRIRYNTGYFTSGAPSVDVYTGTATNQWAYDTAGRLKSIPGVQTAATYTADGQPDSVTRANGTTTDYIYQPARLWLTGMKTTNAAGAVLQNFAYARDARGRITGSGSNIGYENWTYRYDDFDRLLMADNAIDDTLDQGFAYDTVGNMTAN